MIRTVLVPTAVCAASLALTGCGAGGGGATPTVTVTTTETTTATVTSPPVTLTPAPVEPSASDPISALEAWAICRAQPEPDLDPAFWTPLGYTSSAVSGGNGSWTVRLGYNATNAQAGALVTCTANGTLGEPTVALKGPIDL